ncbi:MAG: M48 family metallopeptidase [Lentisphaerota bacterium]
MVIFIIFLAFVGFGFDYFYLGYDPWGPPRPARFPLETSFPFPLATIVIIGLACYWSLWSLYGGDEAVLASSDAVRIYPGNPNPQKQMFINVVHEMAIASGLPMPKVYIIADPDPNAFATGRDPQHASIAVTQGLLDKLSREELQAVVGHEMSHVRNLDIRLMTVIAALVGAAVLLSDWTRRAMWSGPGERRSSRSSRGGFGVIVFLIWAVTWLLAPLLARILAMAVSRQREYLADASSAELTRNPGALAAALKKIESDFAPTSSIKQGTAHLCIADPLGRKIGLREGFWPDLFATHPPMYQRISKLMQMAYQSPNSLPA